MSQERPPREVPIIADGDFAPFETETETVKAEESTLSVGVGVLAVVIALILLACSPPIVIAVWQAAL